MLLIEIRADNQDAVNKGPNSCIWEDRSMVDGSRIASDSNEVQAEPAIGTKPYHGVAFALAMEVGCVSASFDHGRNWACQRRAEWAPLPEYKRTFIFLHFRY